MPTIQEYYQKVFQQDRELARHASHLLPDGITSDSRFAEPFPIYIERAQGSKKWGVGGKEFIDYWAGHGALLLGHNPPEIVEAVTAQMQRGTHYGACHPLEIEWASLITALIPSAERVRFTNSGTEANLLAIRLARAYTGKNKLLRFAGHYHGWQDSLVLGAEAPVEHETAPGIPPGVTDTTIVCPPNDIDAVEKCLKNDPDIACAILEPTGACSGTVPTNSEFLRQLREMTRDYGVVLIFDEIITGFRLCPGGAQAYYQIIPDLTTLAKILCGGLPGGAVAGKEELLNLISQNEAKKIGRGQRVRHYGTFNANPLSASAGIAMLKAVKAGAPHEKVNRLASALRRELNEVIDRNGLDWVVYGEFSFLKFLIGHGVSGLRTVDFDPYRWDYRRLMGRGDPQLRNNLRMGLLLNGIDISLSSVTTTAHSAKDVEQTVAAFEQTIARMKKDGLV
jgi:glutamate-1-semialdehyde 2,1-aminomutase